MNTQELSPVYKVKSSGSKQTTAKWEGLDKLCKDVHQGKIVLWQHHAIFVGSILNGKVSWLTEKDPESGEEHIVKVRAFSPSQEFHFWRSQGILMGRLRIDSDECEKVEWVDTHMVLRRTIAKSLRKSPDPGLRAETLAIKTRNYVGYHPQTHQAGYVDSRFVDFEPFNEKQS